MTEPLDAKRTNPREGGPTFSLGNRLLRLTWSTVWTLFGIWTPVPLHGWRRFLVRLFGGRIAATAKIYPGVAIWTPRNLEMQDYSCLGAGVVCYAMDRVTMEPYALVSQRAHLCQRIGRGGHHLGRGLGQRGVRLGHREGPSL